MQPATTFSSGLIRRCTHEMRLFFIALQFFTRLPIPRWVGFEPDWLQDAVRYFPAVGIVVAAATSLVYAAAVSLLPPAVAVLLSTIAGIYLTGAFHEDGFADVCDGFGGGTTRERVLEIMRDSRVGSYGAIGIGLMLALKCVALSGMPPRLAVAALLIAHPLSRLAAVALIWRLEYAREEGKAKPLARHISTKGLAVAAAIACVPAVLLPFSGWMLWRGVAAGVVAAAIAAAWLARKFVRRIGGYTGDCLGAVQQTAEVMFYLAVLAAVAH